MFTCGGGEGLRRGSVFAKLIKIHVLKCVGNKEEPTLTLDFLHQTLIPYLHLFAVLNHLPLRLSSLIIAIISCWFILI